MATRSAPISRRTLLLAGGAAILAAAGGAAALTLAPGSAEAAGVIYKSPTCGCCAAWADHMAAAGLPLRVEHPSDLGAVKRQHGVSYGMSSCHTAVIDGYVFEGHIPAAEVQRVLDTRPDVVGLAVPGMPIGSPGKEGPGASPYTVFALSRDGNVTPNARITP